MCAELSVCFLFKQVIVIVILFMTSSCFLNFRMLGGSMMSSFTLSLTLSLRVKHDTTTTTTTTTAAAATTTTTITTITTTTTPTTNNHHNTNHILCNCLLLIISWLCISCTLSLTMFLRGG